MDLDSARGLTAADWREWADRLRPEGRHFIDGAYVDSGDGATFADVNPATGNTVAQVARGGQTDVDRAVASARACFRDGRWSRMAPRDRMAVLYRFAELVDEYASELALLDTLDMGKPIAEMLWADVPASIDSFQYFGETIDKIEGQVTNTASEALHYILRQPLGVVGCIVPWNYPLMMAAWKVAPALAAGNTVVLKPAEQSPLSAGLIARLFTEAGGPPGALNVVQGYGTEVGEALALHDDVAKIAFTGSLGVGKQMMIYAGRSNLKRVTTETGGKSPQIVLGDCPDIDTAARYAVDGIFGNQGEVCNAGSRILVERRIADDFVQRFTERARAAYAPGDPLDPATTLGALVNASHQQRVLDYIDIGRREGAEVALGGGEPTGWDHGAFVEPTLLTGVSNDMRVAREEIFGPVGAVIPFDTADEAVAIANDTIFGLAAGIWTSDLGTAHRMARDIEAGVIWVNCYDHGDMTQPWGGFKQSGDGRDKCFETLVAHTQSKSVWVHIDDA